MQTKSRDFMFAIRCAKKAGAFIMERRHQEHQVNWHRKRDFKIEVDKESDQLIRNLIKKYSPGDRVYSEEVDGKPSNGRLWVVDPLDGTFNYTLGMTDHFSISIALNEILGVIYAPKLDELFWASKGVGAYLNGERIRVSTLTDIDRAVIGINHGKKNRMGLMPFFTKLLSKNGVLTFVTVCCASLPLVYVASGKLNAYLGYLLEPWDMAGAVPIIREAGGVVTNLSGKPWKLGDDTILAANSELHKKLLALLQTTSQ